ncbi:WD repeat domain phosphoinositide-interacting protein 2-like isoform X3 [Leptotrombidium deliense]|uniref:WD repeat domain phosphoinositide-interacting protein 2-like isoform X3 n=1 Tax=Leptotrombidium deliense TaxID=299467 RepID=A0A443ST06_9ACAR|nr:WD repeat domain phosphoinositide-interacting protein 2-like isoform X3 [Leptotrombidium deliense]
MNLLQDGEDPNNSIYVSFNRDSSSLAVGTKTGYKIYSFNSTERLDKIHEDNIAIVERLNSSSLVAFVSHSSPRKLRVYHFKKNLEICSHSYSNSILAVKMNRKRLIVCLEGSIYIHTMEDLRISHTIREIPPNPTGLCALSSNDDSCLIAYPCSDKTGEVAVFDCIALQNKNVITAHDNALAAIAFDPAGIKIATASEKGTVIRVYNVLDSTLLYEFRRGYARCVTIYSLAFSYNSLFLCASSDTETVHIFKLEDRNQGRSNEESQSWFGYITRAVSNVLPANMTEVLNQWRSFAIARLPFSRRKNVCGIAMINRSPRVLVASGDGYLYIYDLNENDPGECNLIKQHKLDGIEESENRRPLGM